MQAPIEVSTYDQVKTILSHGEYCIGCKYHEIFNSDEEIVSLVIKNHPYSNQKYSLSDLKDLESKIILVRESKPLTEKGQSKETNLSEDIQESTHNVSVSSDTPVQKLLSVTINGFLEVCTNKIIHVYMKCHSTT